MAKALPVSLDDRDILLAFVRQMPVAVAMFDQEMCYLQASERWCADYELDLNSFIGKSHYDLFPHLPPEWRPAHLRGLAGESLHSDGDRFDFEGRETWVKWDIQPWGNRGGLPEGILIYAEDVTRQKKAERELQARESGISALNDLAANLWRSPDLDAGLTEILSGSIALLNADMGNIQLLDPETGVLRIAVQRGFPQVFLDTFREVKADDPAVCGRTLAAKRRTIVEDVDLDQALAPFREVFRAAGCRAVQSTPLNAADGTPLGIISTHFRKPHRPTEANLGLLDLYARLASAFIERHRSEDARRKRESQLHAALEAMTDAVFISDATGKFVELNESFATFHRSASKEACPRTLVEYTRFLDVSLPDGQLATVDQWAVPRALRGEKAINQEFTLHRKDTGETWIASYNLAPIRDPGGAITGAVVIGRDVTRQRRDEQALAALIRQYQDLGENSPDGIARLDLEGRYVFANQRIAEMGGCRPNDVVGKPIGSIVARDAASWVPIVRRVAESGVIENCDFKFPSGLSLALRFVPERSSDGAVRSVLLIATDVTKHRRDEAALAELSQQYRDLVENSPDGIARLGLDGRYLFANSRMAELGNVDVADFPGKLVGSLTTRNTDFWLATVRRVIQSKQPETVSYPPPGEGSGRAVNVRFIPELLSNATVGSVLMIATDVTELKRTEALARERESMITAVFDSAAQAVIGVDARGVIRLTNRKAEAEFGYGPGELIGLDHNVLVPENLRERHRRHAAAFTAAPRQRQMGVAMDLLGRRKDGALFPIEVSLSHVKAGGETLVVSLATDITIRKQQEAALLQRAEEIRSLSVSLLNAEEESARRIARELHDDITQRLALLSMEIGKYVNNPDPASMGPALRSFQAQILELSEGIRNISHRMHPAILEDLGLSAALDSLCDEVRQSGHVKAEFVGRNVPKDLDPALALSLYRVTQECLRNIQKHTRADEVHVILSEEAGWLRLTVMDNGVGFDPAQAQRGLGIRSMRERVRLVGGALSLTSVPGEGTLVDVRVPVNGMAPGTASHQ